MLQELNPATRIITYEQKADEALLDQILPSASVVLDCSDNFQTRHMVNRACVKHRIPLVSGAAIRFDGQLTVIDPRNPKAPCYACLFPPEQEFAEIQCSTMGVFSPLVGIIGTMQAAQALQLIVGTGETLVGRLLLWDARRTQIDEVRLEKRANCPVCGNH